jgi:glycosyltransferase involved in cell wall biosynthesis
VTTLVERMRDGHFSRMPDRLRLIDCPFPGLSFARNFGIAASRGSVLLFLDDDSVPEGGWLHAMSTAFSNHPDAGVIGGAIQVVLPEPKPSWLAPDWRGYWSQFDPPAQVYQTVKQYWEQPYGANWGARREALVASGGFRTAYGRRDSP